MGIYDADVELAKLVAEEVDDDDDDDNNNDHSPLVEMLDGYPCLSCLHVSLTITMVLLLTAMCIASMIFITYVMVVMTPAGAY